MKIFGIDPGSERTGYGCVEMLGSRHHLVICGAISAPSGATFPERLQHIHAGLEALLARHRPDAVAIENIFHARNVRSALKLGHARGVALLAASEAGLEVFEYTPAEVKRAVVGYGRAEKPQIQQMTKLLLGLDAVPTPHDAADALAIAICHLHRSTGAIAERSAAEKPASPLKSWRDYRPERLRPARGGGAECRAAAPPSARERGWAACAKAPASVAEATRRRGPASSKK